MNVLFTILTVLVLVASVLITLIVLLQNGKGGGLASNFVAGNQTFGVRQTADILEKITWGLVGFIFVVSIVTAFTLNNDTVKGRLARASPFRRFGREHIITGGQENEGHLHAHHRPHHR